MSIHKGKPSGADKPEGTGAPAKPETIRKEKNKTEPFTNKEGELSKKPPVQHPNRNTDKGDATNAGGYRN